MKRFAVGTLLVAILTPVGACGPADDSGYGYAGGGAYGSGPQSCGYYTTCGTCTPVVGCGWCTYSDGSGSCASSADSCGYNYTAFNWDPSGCPGGAPASSASSSFSSSGSSAGVSSSSSSVTSSSSSAVVVPFPDAGPADATAAADVSTASSDASSDSAPSDAASDQSSTTAQPPIVADGGGCQENDGVLCGTSQPWGVTCMQTGPNTSVAEPPPALGCSVVDTTTPAGTLYYCCLEQFGALPPIESSPNTR
jgi:hypothetical protein